MGEVYRKGVDMSIVMVVPCYNEEEVLPLFVQEMARINKKLKRDLHILFVDDGSTDGTLDLLRSYAREPWMSYLSFSRNFGKEAAMYAGFSHAQADYIGVMDADLQHDPKLLPRMEEALDRGYDVCATRRSSRSQASKSYNLGASGFYAIMNRIGDNVHMEAGVQNFRLMKKPVVEAILSLPENGRFSKGIFSWIGYKIKYIETDDRVREAGKSKWSSRKSIRYALDGIFSFSVAPLRLATYLGLIISAAGFLYALYIIINTLLFGPKTAGFPTLASLILILGGLNLLFMGLIGEYVGRIYKEAKRRPIYLVQESDLKDPSPSFNSTPLPHDVKERQECHE